MNTLPMADWANFFVAEVGASAALSGLVVVAISINLSRILAFPQLPGRAAEALVMLVGVLIFTSAALVPNQPTMLLGAEALAIGLAMFLIPLVTQVRMMQFVDGIPLSKQYLRAVVSAAASLPIVAAGILIMLGFGAGLYCAAAGVIVSLVAGVFSAWVLLVEILR
jgi:modulator of FtsH protease